ncbi:hypothetical protein FJ364_00015 [Candidatus Dependentiae bacterium]|nr:hypothetical protein [Candidatus Dependentiae bacterium]
MKLPILQRFMYAHLHEKWSVLKIVIFFILFLITGCSTRVRIATRPQTPLFIAMPINDSAVEPIEQLLYDVLLKNFQTRGYNLVSSQKQGYVLKTTILSLMPLQKFISQDVILLNKLVELKINTSLYNFKNELITQKIFAFETIISKAKVPLQQDAYTSYALHGMLEHHIQIIEQYMRQYLQ